MNLKVKVNGKITAPKVRLMGVDGEQLGILLRDDALNLARINGVDLVEIAASAKPPVCRLVDFGKYRYEENKKVKQSKPHPFAKGKKSQISSKIDLGYLPR